MLKKLILFIIKHRYYLYGCVIYIGTITFIYRGVISDLNGSILDVPGDATGLTWLYNAYPNNPWWGYTHWSNFPGGENLWQPVFLISQLIYIPFWLLAKIFGPTAGYHVLIGIGFLFSSMMMYGLIRWLLPKSKQSVALFAGLAVAFTPYLQVKSPSHPSYVFNGLFTVLIWLLFSYYRNPTHKKSIFTGLVLGSFFYIDPYFILLGGTVFGAFWVSLVIKNKSDLRALFAQHYKRFALTIGVAVLVALPALLVVTLNSSKVDTFVSASRGGIVQDTRAFSARPWEFLIPPFNNPLTPLRVREFQTYHFHGSNLVENTLYLGYIVLALALVGIVALKKGVIRTTIIDRKFLLIFGIILIFMALILSQPPYYNLAGHKILLPSSLLIALTSAWRVLARLVVVMQIGLVIFAAIGIYTVHSKLKKKSLIFAFTSLCFIFLFLEYRVSLPVWSYSKSQTVYQQVKNDSSIAAIAEYPLLDPPQDKYFTLYSAYQQIHRKPMLNTVMPDSSNQTFRGSLANLNNWQTLPVLRSLGVNALLIHTSNEAYPGIFGGLTVAGYSTDKLTHDTAWLYKIVPGSTVDYALVADNGFDGPSTIGYADPEYYLHNKGTLRILCVKRNGCSSAPGKIRIELYGFEKSPRRLTIKQNNKSIWEGQVTGNSVRQVVTFTVDSNSDIELLPELPPKDYSLVVSNMIIQ